MRWSRSPPPTEADKIWLSCHRSVLLLCHNEWITCIDGVALGGKSVAERRGIRGQFVCTQIVGLPRGLVKLAPWRSCESCGVAADAPSASVAQRLRLLAVAHLVH